MTTEPFFSICIPQYNRAQKLLRLLESIKIQNYKSYEVCISDGKSTDNSLELSENYLTTHNINHSISRANKQRRYDENIRNSIAISKGKFLILMGNDDLLKDENSLQDLYKILNCLDYSNFGFLITNFQDLESGSTYYRVGETLNNKNIFKVSEIFRSLSFVSGLVFNASFAKKYSSNEVDGSEMYQMYLAAKFLSNDVYCKLSSLVSVRKDPGDGLLNLAENQLPLPMSKIPNTIAYGIGLKSGEINRELRSVIIQLYLYIYPYWIYRYRGSVDKKIWLKFCASLDPKNLQLKYGMIGNKFQYHLLRTIYYLSIIASICIPKRIFDYILPFLHKIAKRKMGGSVGI
ncbi:Glycosyltransferases involved in cell wall biogenesis [Polynucleobacter duraquae]|uniref:Glycosyltransferases involved in cell wall biogenesis n=1 Tax=Polynucleobacter duraquae TaxID=1835254 RepID=A0A0E3V0K4_9BURK|nr:glycosyltransferase [Polynucleobacter duraquae]AKD24668.1 Glycosyltransferases involved in cell wall biogenesis [Polynucleobacter duraquae]